MVHVPRETIERGLVRNLKDDIYTLSQAEDSGMFLVRGTFALKIVGKRKYTYLGDNTKIADLNLKEGSLIYLEKIKGTNPAASVLDADLFDDDEDENSDFNDSKKPKTTNSVDNTAERRPHGHILIEFDNTGDVGVLASLIINNGVRSAEEVVV